MDDRSERGFISWLTQGQHFKAIHKGNVRLHHSDMGPDQSKNLFLFKVILRDYSSI